MCSSFVVRPLRPISVLLGGSGLPRPRWLRVPVAALLRASPTRPCDAANVLDYRVRQMAQIEG
jgi:hypothetical protein